MADEKPTKSIIHEELLIPGGAIELDFQDAEKLKLEDASDARMTVKMTVNNFFMAFSKKNNLFIQQNLQKNSDETVHQKTIKRIDILQKKCKEYGLNKEEACLLHLKCKLLWNSSSKDTSARFLSAIESYPDNINIRVDYCHYLFQTQQAQDAIFQLKAILDFSNLEEHKEKLYYDRRDEESCIDILKEEIHKFSMVTVQPFYLCNYLLAECLKSSNKNSGIKTKRFREFIKAINHLNPEADTINHIEYLLIKTSLMRIKDYYGDDKTKNIYTLANECLEKFTVNFKYLNEQVPRPLTCHTLVFLPRTPYATNIEILNSEIGSLYYNELNKGIFKIYQKAIQLKLPFHFDNHFIEPLINEMTDFIYERLIHLISNDIKSFKPTASATQAKKLTPLEQLQQAMAYYAKFFSTSKSFKQYLQEKYPNFQKTVESMITDFQDNIILLLERTNKDFTILQQCHLMRNKNKHKSSPITSIINLKNLIPLASDRHNHGKQVIKLEFEHEQHLDAVVYKASPTILLQLLLVGDIQQLNASLPVTQSSSSASASASTSTSASASASASPSPSPSLGLNPSANSIFDYSKLSSAFEVINKGIEKDKEKLPLLFMIPRNIDEPLQNQYGWLKYISHRPSLNLNTTLIARRKTLTALCRVYLNEIEKISTITIEKELEEKISEQKLIESYVASEKKSDYITTHIEDIQRHSKICGLQAAAIHLLGMCDLHPGNGIMHRLKLSLPDTENSLVIISYLLSNVALETENIASPGGVMRASATSQTLFRFLIGTSIRKISIATPPANILYFFDSGTAKYHRCDLIAQDFIQGYLQGYENLFSKINDVRSLLSYIKKNNVPSRSVILNTQDLETESFEFFENGLKKAFPSADNNEQYAINSIYDYYLQILKTAKLAPELQAIATLGQPQGYMFHMANIKDMRISIERIDIPVWYLIGNQIISDNGTIITLPETWMLAAVDKLRANKELRLQNEQYSDLISNMSESSIWLTGYGPLEQIEKRCTVFHSLYIEGKLKEFIMREIIPDIIKAFRLPDSMALAIGPGTILPNQAKIQDKDADKTNGPPGLQ